MGAEELASLKIALETASNWSERATILVTVGVLIELVALFIFSKEMPFAEKGVMVFATALIVLGCGGEYVFGSRAGAAATAIQQASDDSIALLTLDAETAKSVAAEAKLALEKLKSPRTLSPERQKFVLTAVAQFKGQRYETAISQAADDGLALWESLYASLKNAGWVYLPSEGLSVGRPPAGVPISAIPGIEIRLDPSKKDELLPAALALGNALHADGTIVAINIYDKTFLTEDKRDTLQIFIGARVPPQ